MIYIVVTIFAISYMSFRGNSMLTTLYAIELGASTWELGIIASLVALGPMFLAFYAGKISDRLGFKIPITFGSLGISLALLLPYFIKGKLIILYLSQALYGFGIVFLIVSMQNLTGCLGTPETRPKNYSIYSMGVSAANFAGPLITGFSIDHISFHSSYLILSFLAAVTGIVLVFNLVKLPPPPQKQAEKNQEKTVSKGGVRELLAVPAIRDALTSSGIILTGVVIYDFYFPIFSQRIGLSASVIGIILSINAAAFFLVRFFMPVLVSKFTENNVLIGCFWITAVSFFLLPLFANAVALGIISFFVGVGLGCGQPLTMTLAFNASPPGRTGEVLGLRLTVNKIVQFFVPIIFGSVGTVFAAIPVFWSNALMLGSGGCLVRKKNVLSKRHLQDNPANKNELHL
ncbi:MAG TPA: MFS transporter [Peptococcaceae bacterium]|nr:MFS transporter [Peptococcaceae bacterium]